MESLQQIIQLLQANDIEVHFGIILLTIIGSYYVIKNLKLLAFKYPYRQFVPAIIAILLYCMKDYTIGNGIDKTTIWNAIVNAFIAVGMYAKGKSVLKDRGLLR